VVETMGSLDDAQYLERKRRTHELMRRIPGVVDVLEHDPTDPGDTRRLRRALNATVIVASDRRPRAAPRADGDRADAQGRPQLGATSRCLSAR
jgi:hypothetical protein